MEDLPRTVHPRIWLPSGRPALAWIEETLERVMTMASRIKPICTPMRPLVVWFRDGVDLAEDVKSESTKSSNRRYTTPTATIKAPPSKL